ncbi:MAG: DNA polymerase III subunit gamma/tau [Candidatus Carbobacillus sp.]|nr:DNA polymerase III subunit gamma/tau [Candidatus Carbobacillus sp.]
MYRALYLTYRPQRFSDLAGQSHIAETLKHAVKTRKIAHAYLFSGSRGTGKTTAARILAKAINCLAPVEGEPCLKCEHCQRIERGETLDILELDAASNRGIEDMRSLRDATLLRPSKLPYKVYIIDEVHMLTSEAANALLKTLEEPPEYVIFILATTDPQKLPATIVSRTQRFDFKRLLPDVIQKRLLEVAEQEGMEIDQGALRLLSIHAEGGMRDALALLDQARAFCGETITKDDVEQLLGIPQEAQIAALLKAIEEGEVASISQTLEAMYADGRDAVRILSALLQAMRENVLKQETVEKSHKTLESTRNKRLLSIMTQLLSLEPILRRSYDPFLFLEVGLMKASVELPLSTEPKGSNVQPSVLPEHTEHTSETTSQPIREVPLSSKDSRRPSPSRLETASRGVLRDKLVPFLDETAEENVRPYQARWTELLNRIKAFDIRTEAWFKQGIPKAFHGQTLLIVFSKTLHRETVEKEEHRARIEQALSQVFGQPLTFITMMEEAWLKAREAVRSEEKSEEPKDKIEEDPLVREAIALVGQDYVEVIDRRKKG